MALARFLEQHTRAKLSLSNANEEKRLWLTHVENFSRRKQKSSRSVEIFSNFSWYSGWPAGWLTDARR